MALWTPYGNTDDCALDLSKGAAVKIERHSPNFNPRPSESLEMRFSLQTNPLYLYQQALLETQCVPILSPVREKVSLDSSMYSEVHSPPRELTLSQSSGSEEASLSPGGRAPPRPFKAFTASLPMGTKCPSAAVPDPDYAAYRARMLNTMRFQNGGSLCVSNPRMRREVRRSSDSPDAEYLERRARNNAAAKRSRDLRRMKEDELAIKTSYLEHNNQQLRTELDIAHRQLAQYRTASV